MTGPAHLALCGECAATHHKMAGADLAAEVDAMVGGRSLDELWEAATETARSIY